jgi:hypothetical protein
LVEELTMSSSKWTMRQVLVPDGQTFTQKTAAKLALAISEATAAYQELVNGEVDAVNFSCYDNNPCTDEKERFKATEVDEQPEVAITRSD